MVEATVNEYKRMWQAALILAFEDLKSEDEKIRRDARLWFFDRRYERDFQEVCYCAGRYPDEVKKVARNIRGIV